MGDGVMGDCDHNDSYTVWLTGLTLVNLRVHLDVTERHTSSVNSLLSFSHRKKLVGTFKLMEP